MLVLKFRGPPDLFLSLIHPNVYCACVFLIVHNRKGINIGPPLSCTVDGQLSFVSRSSCNNSCAKCISLHNSVSANTESKLLILTNISLINKINSIGPKTELWHTPLKTLDHLENESFTTTLSTCSCNQFSIRVHNISSLPTEEIVCTLLYRVNVYQVLYWML